MLCLIGSPVGHSGSPAMYNYSFQKLGLDYVYLAFDIKEEDTSKAINALRLLNVKGFNITMPGKTAALSCCDELSKAAQLIGAVNTVENIAAITEIATGFKEFIREESDPDNLAVPASCSIIAAKYPKPPRIIKYGQCSF